MAAEPLPSTVRYATGFVQGAEAAADSMGVQVYIRIWYSSMTASDDDLTDYVCGWYDEGFQVVMAATPELADSCIQAAEKSGREVIATGWDCAGQSSSVITSAVNCYSTVVQNELYLFGTQNNWDQDHSGQTETLGTEVDAVGLATQEWRLKTFTGEEYRELYQRMAAGTVKVERYSDTTAAADPECDGGSAEPVTGTKGHCHAFVMLYTLKKALPDGIIGCMRGMQTMRP